MSESARPTVQVDNERVRVTEWRFAPGAEHDVVNANLHEFVFVEIEVKVR